MNQAPTSESNPYNSINVDFEPFALHTLARTGGGGASSLYRVNGAQRGGSGNASTALPGFPLYIAGSNNEGATVDLWPGGVSLFFVGSAVGFNNLGFSDAVAQLLNDINPGVFP